MSVTQSVAKLPCRKGNCWSNTFWCLYNVCLFLIFVILISLITQAITY